MSSIPSQSKSNAVPDFVITANSNNPFTGLPSSVVSVSPLAHAQAQGQVVVPTLNPSSLSAAAHHRQHPSSSSSPTSPAHLPSTGKPSLSNSDDVVLDLEAQQRHHLEKFLFFQNLALQRQQEAVKQQQQKQEDFAQLQLLSTYTFPPASVQPKDLTTAPSSSSVEENLNTFFAFDAAIVDNGSSTPISNASDLLVTPPLETTTTADSLSAEQIVELLSSSSSASHRGSFSSTVPTLLSAPSTPESVSSLPLFKTPTSGADSSPSSSSSSLTMMTINPQAARQSPYPAETARKGSNKKSTNNQHQHQHHTSSSSGMMLSGYAMSPAAMTPMNMVDNGAGVATSPFPQYTHLQMQHQSDGYQLQQEPLIYNPGVPRNSFDVSGNGVYAGMDVISGAPQSMSMLDVKPFEGLGVNNHQAGLYAQTPLNQLSAQYATQPQFSQMGTQAVSNTPTTTNQFQTQTHVAYPFNYAAQGYPTSSSPAPSVNVVLPGNQTQNATTNAGGLVMGPYAANDLNIPPYHRNYAQAPPSATMMNVGAGAGGGGSFTVPSSNATAGVVTIMKPETPSPLAQLNSLSASAYSSPMISSASASAPAGPVPVDEDDEDEELDDDDDDDDEEEDEIEQVHKNVFASTKSSSSLSKPRPAGNRKRMSSSASSTYGGGAHRAGSSGGGGVLIRNPMGGGRGYIPGETPDDPKKRHKCVICGRGFARLYNLKSHGLTHDPARPKPYACPHDGCPRAFSRLHDLERHQQGIHGEGPLMLAKIQGISPALARAQERIARRAERGALIQ